MNTQQTIIAVLLVVLIGGGVFWYNQKHVMAPAVTNEPMFSASMSCMDGSHFIAEFNADNSVTIVVDGEDVRTLTKVDGDGQRFEDVSYAYVFAGEEVEVTTKETNVMTTCSQPMDPNNAPINFGDRGEGNGTQPDVALVVSESIVGKWQSNEDSKFTREFKADGTVTDWYDGKTTSTGTFTTFTKVTAPAVSFPLESDVVYVQIKDADGLLNYKVTKLTPESLELIYLERGNTLTFTAANS